MFVKIARFLEYLIDHASYLLLVFSGAMIVVMAWAVTYGVTRRYFLNSPEPYSYEISAILLLVCTILTIAQIQKLGRNIRVDFVANHFPERIQVILFNVIGPIIGLIFSVVLTWKSWDYAMYANKIGLTSVTTWGEPLFPVIIIVPIGAGLLSLMLLAQIIRWFTSIIKGRPRSYGSKQEVQ